VEFIPSSRPERKKEDEGAKVLGRVSLISDHVYAASRSSAKRRFVRIYADSCIIIIIVARVAVVT
jgi:hypothetical protein